MRIDEYERDEAEEKTFEDIASQMYYDEESDKSDFFFSVSVTQIAVCLVLAAALFVMSFFGNFREKVCEAADYFASFELTKDDIDGEVSAIKEFFGDVGL